MSYFSPEEHRGDPSLRTPESSRYYDPPLPPPDLLDFYGALVLDPTRTTVVAGLPPVRSTVYRADRLLVPRDIADETLRLLAEVARSLGLDATLEPDPLGGGLEHTVRSLVLRAADPDVPTAAPDAWTVLQWARSRAWSGPEQLRGVGLDHLLFASQPGVNTVRARAAGPAREAEAISDYARQGGGGRQPVAWLGPEPPRRPAEALAHRRPVVAVLDSGCGRHPWLDDVVQRDLTLDGTAVGYADLDIDPERSEDLVETLDDAKSAMAGHGTFMAGLVRMGCPDADLLSLRVMQPDGVMLESELVLVLAQLAELVRRHRTGLPGGRPIDVLVVSTGYYHESPEEEPFAPALMEVLAELGRLGVLVVAAAGNDATRRPFLPAAFAPYRDGRGLTVPDPDRVPVVSVLASNPNDTVALFSNDGPWVRARAHGASVVSTVPVTFHGGLAPQARIGARGARYLRESLDPDDYRSGFAVWSGTSFAAPVLAGRLARSLLDELDRAGPVDEGEAAAVERAWRVLEEADGVDIQRP